MDRHIRLIPIAFLALLLCGCSVHQAEPAHDYSNAATWVVLPFDNHSETPMASERVEALTLSALRARQLDAQSVPTTGDPYQLPRVADRHRYDEALAFARSMGVAYGVTGSVVEWRYKSGLDGEPAVGVAMHVVEVATGDTLWSGSFSRSGWSRESLSGTGQKVIAKLVSGILKG